MDAAAYLLAFLAAAALAVVAWQVACHGRDVSLLLARWNDQLASQREDRRQWDDAYGKLLDTALAAISDAQAKAQAERDRLLDRIQARDLNEYLGVQVAKDIQPQVVAPPAAWEEHPDLTGASVRSFSRNGQKWWRVTRGDLGDEEFEDIPDPEFQARYGGVMPT